MEIPGYKIRQPIGAGGMATAYLAVQESLGRPVVLKVLSPAGTDRKADIGRFLNEGRIVASLNHPNVITVYDIGVAEDCRYISMEYVDGGDLRAKMHTILTPAEALDIVIRIGRGLSAAHQKGIVHRDVKPANILFRRDGTPLLSDFGIAKQLSVDSDLTMTGVFLGSPNYMAPEQAEAGPIDCRVDIYSLGIIFYEMLTGTKPYVSSSVVDVIVQHKLAPLPTLPPGLEEYQPLLNLMIGKQRKDRFRDVDSMLHYIRHRVQSGVVKSAIEVTRTPDVDSSGPHPRVLDQGHKIALPQGSQFRVARLGALLVLSALVYAALYYAESRVDVAGATARSGDPGALEIESVPLEPPVARPSPPAANASGALGQAAPSAATDTATQEVVQALGWLASKSMDDYRLTSPPKDNAYYYFSRLLEIDPSNASARQGLLKIADRYAYLAERELAANHYRKAQRYVTVGLQIDPNHEALLTLRSLAQPQRKGFIEGLVGLFRRERKGFIEGLVELFRRD